MNFLVITIIIMSGYASQPFIDNIDNGQSLIEVIQSDRFRTTIEFTLYEFSAHNVIINDKDFTHVNISGSSYHNHKGFPAVPTITRSIAIPENAIVEYHIKNMSYDSIKVPFVVPSKGNLYRNTDPSTVPYTLDEYYQTDTWWPDQVVMISEPFLLRDLRGITIRINPCQYNPSKQILRIYKKLILDIHHSIPENTDPQSVYNPYITNEFLNIYRNFFINFDETRYDSISERAGRMVIITDDEYTDELQPYIQWKKLKGIKVKTENISAIGNNESAIKSYIQNEYDAGDLVWVLLVGDADEVVPATGTVGAATGALADPVYAYTAGSDYYPDIFISRFSSLNGNALNIQKQVQRSINYERNPIRGAQWYHVGLGVASDQNQQGGPRDSTRCNWLRDSLLNYHYSEVNKSYDQWGTTALIKGYIENGTSIINYIGHGSPLGWANGGGFTITDINMLSNPAMLPFVISVACYVGYFDSIDCYCEVSVTAGDLNQADGFLCHWGSTIAQSWDPPCYAQEEAINLLTQNKKNSFGGLCFNGACHMIEEYLPQNDGIEMAQTWHIFGDASIQVRTNTPDSMIVEHDSTIAPSPCNFSLHVTDDDGTTPIKGALVCCWIPTQIPELHEISFTDVNGNAQLNLTPNNPEDTMWVTVTAYNYIPYEGYAIVREPQSVHENSEPSIFFTIEVRPTIFSDHLRISYRHTIYNKPKIKPMIETPIHIYNSVGRLIKILNLNEESPYPSACWDGSDLSGRQVPEGIYFIALPDQSSNTSMDYQVKKVVRIKNHADW